MRSCKFESCPGHLKALNISAFSFMYDEIPGIRSVVSPGRQSEAAAPGERRYFFRYPYFDNDDVFTTRETGVFSGILAGEPTIRFDIIPAGCYRNLFAICRVKSGIPMSGERPRRSGSNAPARFGSGCGFRPEGEGEAVIRAQTGAWPFLEIGGFLQKNGNYRSKQGCMTRNGQTYAAWRLLNAQRWNPTHRPQFASSSRDRDERVRIGARTIRFRIHYAPKTKNLTYH